MEFLNRHLRNRETSFDPFFLYYPSNSNHGPYTVDEKIGGQKVKGAGKLLSGESASGRLDYIYENDVALGRLLDFLEKPKTQGVPAGNSLKIPLLFSHRIMELKLQKTATGPMRSNKGSCYEGGHRVPFIVSWPSGEIGNGEEDSPGEISHQLIGLQDLYATFSHILDKPLPKLREGQKGAEDSYNILPAWNGKVIANRPMFYNDHKEGENGAASAMRINNPIVNEKSITGAWKIFFQ